MPTCKFCGAETGESKFCQNCGAKVEETTPVMQPQFQQPIVEQPQFQQPMMQQPIQQPYGQYQPSYYTPKGAGGLLAGNIILIVLGAVCCCFIYPLIWLVLGIIGTVYAAKVKNSHSAEEEAHNRKVARIMMLIGYGVLIVCVILLIAGMISEYGSFGDAVDALEETWDSIYESVSESMENAFRIR